MISQIQYISQADRSGSHIRNIKRALDAGCDWIQLRIKEQSLDFVRSEAALAKVECEKYGARLLINDYIHIAKEMDADGVHLGLTDDKISLAREILGEQKLIGGTANTLEDVILRHTEGVDYVGLGPYAFTATKAKLSPILGLEGYRKILIGLQEAQVKTPIIAIGGLDEAAVKSLLELGIHGFAISGLLNTSESPVSLISEIYHTINDYQKNRVFEV